MEPSEPSGKRSQPVQKEISGDLDRIGAGSSCPSTETGDPDKPHATEPWIGISINLPDRLDA